MPENAASSSADERRQLFRHVVLLVDLSEAVRAPKVFRRVKKAALSFIPEFFVKNPLAHLAVVAMSSGTAQRLSGFSCSMEEHLQSLDGAVPSGAPSIMNGLKLSLHMMRSLPEYSSKEVIVVFHSTRTVDPGDIFQVVRENPRLFIHTYPLLCDVHVLRTLALLSGGIFTRNLSHLLKPPVMRNADVLATTLVRCGFLLEKACPVCLAPTDNVPTNCKVCGIRLLNAAHLDTVRMTLEDNAIVPVAGGVAAVKKSEKSSNVCQVCFNPLLMPRQQEDEISIYRCTRCGQLFCQACGRFMHQQNLCLCI